MCVDSALCARLILPQYLNSALGRSDGKVYENLIAHGIHEPVNSYKWNTIVDDPELIIGEPPLAKL